MSSSVVSLDVVLVVAVVASCANDECSVLLKIITKKDDTKVMNRKSIFMDGCCCVAKNVVLFFNSNAIRINLSKILNKNFLCCE